MLQLGLYGYRSEVQLEFSYAVWVLEHERTNTVSKAPSFARLLSVELSPRGFLYLSLKGVGQGGLHFLLWEVFMSSHTHSFLGLAGVEIL